MKGPPARKRTQRHTFIICRDDSLHASLSAVSKDTIDNCVVVIAHSIYAKILEMEGDSHDQLRPRSSPEGYLLPYSEIPKDIPDPYFFSLSKGKHYIDYFGSPHSYDPQDPMFEELTVRWNEFKVKTRGKNCYVVI
ncbi:MAG: hypothetical protein UZ21_OP11001000276 [Microgenomates bacterium OLB22]|nr:MAG: hypothetical protein UZ21_OP11001000276 [Microgenomates bacterium OLB22]